MQQLKKTPRNFAQSKEIAKERLKNILMRDRVEVSQEMMELVKEDMLSVAQDYFSVSQKGAEIYLTHMKKNNADECESTLVCLIPVSKVKKEA